MLEIRNLRKAFGDLQVLKGIDLDVNKGDVVAIPVSYTHLTLPTILRV